MSAVGGSSAGGGAGDDSDAPAPVSQYPYAAARGPPSPTPIPSPFAPGQGPTVGPYAVATPTQPITEDLEARAANRNTPPKTSRKKKKVSHLRHRPVGRVL